MPYKFSWPAHVVEKLTLLWQTKSAGEIVQIFADQDGIHLTRNAVIGKLKRLKLTVEHKTVVSPMARENGHKRVRAPRGKSTGSFAFGVICKIKAKKDGLGAPDAPLKLRPDVADIQPLHITLDELTPKTCRWIYGEPGAWTYCGCEKISDGPYCWAHDEMSKPVPSARKALARAA